jgi:hypothetical protein
MSTNLKIITILIENMIKLQKIIRINIQLVLQIKFLNLKKLLILLIKHNKKGARVLYKNHHSINKKDNLLTF